MIPIKRYPNRKLYNTVAKEYINLDGIAKLIRQGEEVQVTDHASGEDLTALTLTQIILDQEKKQNGVLSHAALTSLIRSGSDRLSALQRGLFSPVFWQQIDEEIRRRVQALVRQGEMTMSEGEALLEKMLQQGVRLREERRGKQSEVLVNVEELEAYLSEHQVPTQEDIRQLSEQLEALAAKLEEIVLIQAQAE